MINLSNALLQSSVNSFGATAMAGYTAANNILSFMYVSVNSVTQACMSFTSQNYSAGKFKRMDRVLGDCLIFTVITAGVMGTFAYAFGPQVLGVYTEEEEVIRYGMEILSIPRFHARHGTFRCTDDFVCAWNRWNKTDLDFWCFPAAQVLICIVYFLSGFLVYHHCDAGVMFLLCEKKSMGSKSIGEKQKNLRKWMDLLKNETN